jgi:hypothetical protein
MDDRRRQFADPRSSIADPRFNEDSMNRFVAAIGICIALAACAKPNSGTMAQSTAQPAPSSGTNTLTAAERAAGWRLLFDGKTTTGWRGYKMNTMPAEWMAMDGTLMKEKPTEDIVTTDQFGDFDFVFEWKVTPGGNAGVFYRATEEYEKVYWSATEYQLLDDAGHPDGRNALTSAASNYGLYAPTVKVVKPANEWNSSRIVAKGTHVEHWLNGQKVVEYDYFSPDWEAKVKAAKFKDWPKYGRATRGLIAIQGDHGGVLALRNIKIRELK